MTLQELVTKYTFEIDTKPLEKVEEKVSGLIGFVGKLALAGSAAAGAVFGMAKLTAQAGDEAYAMSQKIGISVEKLTALEFAAKQSNVESGGLAVGLRFLSKNMSDASKGMGDSGQDFRKLGVNFKDGTGKLRATDEVMLDLASKFKSMPDGAKKTATAMNLFGKAGVELIPLLNEGSGGIKKMMDRAEELGLVMSTDLAKAGDEFNDSMDELMGSFTGIRNVVGSQLIPILTPLIKKITDFVVQNRKLIATRIEFFMKMLMTFAKGVYDIFSALVRIGSGLSKIFGGFENVVKLLTAAFLIFAGAKILFMIGTLTTAIAGLGAMITWVNIQALLIPIAIGAIVAIVALLIEDLYTFFTDPEADTLTKDLVDGIKSLWNMLTGFFGEMPAWGQMIANYLLAPFRMVVNTIKSIGEIIDLIKGKTSFGDFASNIFGNIKNTVAGGDTLGSAFGFTPSSSPANTSTAQDNSMKNQMQVTNNINVGAGADPTMVGKSVQQGTKDGLDGALRGVQRSYATKGGY